LIGKIYLKI